MTRHEATEANPKAGPQVYISVAHKNQFQWHQSGVAGTNCHHVSAIYRTLTQRTDFN